MNKAILTKIHDHSVKMALCDNGIILMVVDDYSLTRPAIIYINSDTDRMISYDEIMELISTSSVNIKLCIIFETNRLDIINWVPGSKVKLEFPGFFELSQLEWEINTNHFDNDDNPSSVNIDMIATLGYI